MKPLTIRQQEVLAFLSSFISQNSYPPTIREVGAHFNISVKGAYDHLLALRKKGWITFDSKLSRAISLVEDTEKQERTSADAFMEIPVMGHVAAGRPLLAEENKEGMVYVPFNVLKTNRQYFGLKIQGDSMIGAGIIPEDTVIIEKTDFVRNRDIVVAMLDERITIKRYIKESSRICLLAENPEYKPIYCQDVRIIGKLIYLLRSY